MPNHLTLGGGVLSLKYKYDDAEYSLFGYVSDFSLAVEAKRAPKEMYAHDTAGNIVRVKTSNNNITQVYSGGGFTCESLSRKLLQSLWFQGTDDAAGTALFNDSLVDTIRALKFVSSAAMGSTFCFKAPAVYLKINKKIKFLNQTSWANVDFEFETIIDTIIDSVPTLKIAEEGEDLTGFCDG
ncbi:MAG: hypothetical protein GWN00_01365 [Aliifodinibius sp.]|nr:hypothetical protein [Fodinibius sp.]NIV09981.1 hypothetical protein [Fodinibius sp.]NIY23511.1 hypothetical protein [Fodinibius sp.]